MVALEAIPNDARPDAFNAGVLDRLLRALAPPAQEFRGSPYDYLLSHKQGLQLLAGLRHAITHNYSKQGVLNGRPLFVSPALHQWFEDGVMLLQGEQRFAGLIGLFQNGKLKFGIAARDAIGGDELGPDDFLFVDVEDASQRFAGRDDLSIDAASERLQQLLHARTGGEAHYQSYFEQFPWAFGAQYVAVQSHRRLDDANIPDFTGVRCRDRARDILEIKDPFLKLFRSDEDFSADFNDAWNQAERYLDFARREEDYLRRQKGLRFENPHCYLIIGYQLSAKERAKVRRRERMNPAVSVLTYDDLLAVVRQHGWPDIRAPRRGNGHGLGRGTVTGASSRMHSIDHRGCHSLP